MAKIDDQAKLEIGEAKAAMKKPTEQKRAQGGLTHFPDDPDIMEYPKRVSRAVARSNARSAGAYRKIRRSKR
jgi:hypothetical protein